MSTYTSNDNTRYIEGGGRASYTPAHESFAVAAPFRAWPNSQIIIAGEPTRPP